MSPSDNKHALSLFLVPFVAFVAFVSFVVFTFFLLYALDVLIHSFFLPRSLIATTTLLIAPSLSTSLPLYFSLNHILLFTMAQCPVHGHNDVPGVLIVGGGLGGLLLGILLESIKVPYHIFERTTQVRPLGMCFRDTPNPFLLRVPQVSC